jgi:Tol biopolymer transport system component
MGLRLRPPRALCASAALLLAGLLADPADATFPGHNGRLVVGLHLSGPEKLYLVKADGSDPRQVSHGPGTDLSASFSRRGDKIVFHRFRAGDVVGLFSVRADGSRQHRLPGSGPGTYFPAFTADPRTIAYGGGVYTMRLDGTHSRQLSGDSDDGHPVSSSDGRKIAFTHYNASNGHDQAYVMRADGSHVRLLADSASPSSFSPDSRRLLLSKGGDIYVMKLKDRSLRRLTKNPFDENHAVFSPIGHQIAFVRHESVETDDASQVGVWMMRADGSRQRRIIDEVTGSLDWQPLPR